MPSHPAKACRSDTETLRTSLSDLLSIARGSEYGASKYLKIFENSMFSPKFNHMIARIAVVSDLGKNGGPKLKRNILLLAVFLFAGGIILSIYHQPDIFLNLDWRPIAFLIAACVPATILLNALEFGISARLIDRSVSIGKALEVTVIGSAANMLPLPGAALTRVLGLKAAGGGYKEGAAVTGLIAFVWLGIALFVSGAALCLLGTVALGSVAMGIGALVTVFTVMAMGRITQNWPLSFLVAIIKIVFVALDGLRIYLCLLGLGIGASYLQAMVLVVGGVVGSAVSIVPAGLGVREAVSAGLAPIVGLAASAGFIAATLNRLLGMLVLLPLALGLANRLRAAGSETSSRSTQF